MTKNNQQLYQAIDSSKRKEKHHTQKASIYFTLFLLIIGILIYTAQTFNVSTSIEEKSFIINTIIYLIGLSIAIALGNTIVKKALFHLNQKEQFNHKKITILSYIALKEDQLALTDKKEISKFENELIDS